VNDQPRNVQRLACGIDVVAERPLTREVRAFSRTLPVRQRRQSVIARSSGG